MWSRSGAGLLVATALLTAGCGAGSTPPPTPTSLPSVPPASAAPHEQRRGIQGTVTAENGSTWTVTTAAQRAFTVTVTPQTTFGTRRDPATAAQFPVGAHVRVAGTVDGTAVTAVRITSADDGQPAPAPPTPVVATV